MSVSGTWNITIKSPIGDQKSTLTLEESGASLTGALSGPAGNSAISDGKVEGNNVSWKASVTQPMPITLEFTGTVDGDALSGSVKLGMFGNAPFSGTRG